MFHNFKNFFSIGFIKKIKIFKSFIFLYIFLLSNVQYSIQPFSKEDKQFFIEQIQKILVELQPGILKKFFLSFGKSIFMTFGKKFADAAIEYWENKAQMASNKVALEDLDKSVVELIFPLDVENNLKTYEEGIINNLRAGRPLTNLLLAGPAGTGKTTGAERVAENIQNAIKKMGNTIEIVGIVIDKFSGGEIYGKGITFATKHLVEKINYWKEVSKTRLVIIILDEMEVLFPNREQLGNSEKNDIITLFLSFTGNNRKNIMIMGATNHESALDPAVRRRFSSFINVKAPDLMTIAKIMISYIKYYGDNPDIHQNFDIEAFQHLIFYMAERILSMSGADIDNMIKKSVQEASSGLGFLYWYLLVKNMNDEIYKKATFSIKLSEDKKSELKKLLLIEDVFTWFNYINPSLQFVKLGIDYEVFINKQYEMIFYSLQNSIYNSLISFVSLQLITTKGCSMGTIQNIKILNDNNNYLMRKFFNNKNNITTNLAESYGKAATISNMSIDQVLSREIPKKGEHIANIPQKKVLLNTLSNNHKNKVMKVVYKTSTKIKNIYPENIIDETIKSSENINKKSKQNNVSKENKENLINNSKKVTSKQVYNDNFQNNLPNENLVDSVF